MWVPQTSWVPQTAPSNRRRRTRLQGGERLRLLTELAIPDVVGRLHPELVGCEGFEPRGPTKGSVNAGVSPMVLSLFLKGKGTWGNQAFPRGVL